MCRDFFCGWRLLPKLDQAWRPDLSGVMILPDDDNIPDAYDERPGLKFLLTVSARPILWPAFTSYVAGLVEARVPVFLAVPGPAGFHFAKAFLNDHLAGAVAARDGGEMIRIMAAIVDRLRQGGFDPVALASSRAGPST